MSRRREPGPAHGKLLAGMGLALTLLMPSSSWTQTRIYNGELSSDVPAVGAIISRHDGEVDFRCTGTLVSPRWVLTAAHCMGGIRNAMDNGWPVTFFVGPDVLDTAIEEIEVIETEVHPLFFRPDDSPPENDIGLLELAANAATAPLPLNNETVSGAWFGTLLTVMGYGRTTEPVDDAGLKREGIMEATSLYEPNFVILDPYGDPRINVCIGDSGGPSLELDSQSQHSVVAVTIFGDEPCVDGSAGVLRVDPYLSWISSFTVPCLDDVPCVPVAEIFVDGFERGDLSRWSASSP